MLSVGQVGEKAVISVFGVVIFKPPAFLQLISLENWDSFLWVVPEILASIQETQAALAPSLLISI